jgi:hypothetical protein
MGSEILMLGEVLATIGALFFWGGKVTARLQAVEGSVGRIEERVHGLVVGLTRQIDVMASSACPHCPNTQGAEAESGGTEEAA